MDFLIRAKTFVFPLLFIIVLVSVLFFNGNRDVAWTVACLGTSIVMLGNIIFIAAYNSRNRWPNTTWLMRLGRLFFFER